MPLRHIFRPLIQFRNLPTPIRWIGSAGFVGLAFLARYLAYGTEPVVPFLFFLPAVIASAVIFDRRSSLVATILSVILIIYFFLAPIYNITINHSRDVINTIIYIGICAFVGLVTESLHEAYVESEESRLKTEGARQRAEAAERERALLLAELRHRVGNDLQRIAGMMHLQGRRASSETAAALQDAAARVMVIARVHDRLSRHEGQVTVDLRAFLHDLVADLRSAVTDLRPIGLFVEAEDHGLSVMRTGSLGLIVNELVTNSLKHAFPMEWEQRGVEGRITVVFRKEGADFVLTVTDNGIGLAERADKDSGGTGGMGTHLVRALTAQLGGHIESKRHPHCGTVHELRFPIVRPGDPEEAVVGA